jgi:hypothetical protein
MATKKAATKALVRWDEKFASAAKASKEQLKNVTQGGIGIRFGRDKIFVADNEVKGGKLEVIIAGFCAFNGWYEADYDPKGDKTPPTCYAYSDIFDDDNMAPHSKVEKPQADKCCDCEKNKFGTAKVGRGKACGNNIRFGALLASDIEDGDAAKSAELATGKISPTNVKRFKKYVDDILEEHGRPVWAVITEITSHDDSDTQIRLEFKLVDVIDDDGILEAMEARSGKIQDILQVPFQVAADGIKSAPKVKVGTNKKFAGKAPARGKK